MVSLSDRIWTHFCHVEQIIVGKQTSGMLQRTVPCKFIYVATCYRNKPGETIVSAGKLTYFYVFTMLNDFSLISLKLSRDMQQTDPE